MRAAHEEHASRTAGLVAFLRSIAKFLPADAQLAVDPYGALFGGDPTVAVVRGLERTPKLTRRVIEALEPRASVLWLQLRSRAIDDAVRTFVAQGGRQVLLLGAGFDCRAARLADVLGDAVVFEVDHPSTQARKRHVLAGAQARSAPVRYLAWDFERDPLSELPARLAQEGHDRAAPTLTIWEGVTMYLSPAAIEASLSALGALSAPRSVLVFTYIDQAGLRSEKFLSRIVSSLGEPFTFGWDPPQLPSFLAARGWSLRSDESMTDLAHRLLPARYHRMLANGTRHVAIAEHGATR